jgi:hypothetical protein
MPVPAQASKLQRVSAITPLIEAGNIFLPGASSPDGAGYDRARTPP